MRKMTYTQAATCGKNLKVRVTPEQSEKMQRAWFKAGKTWKGGDTSVSLTNEIFLYLYGDAGVLTVTECGDCFIQHKNEEIKLIDETQHDFASQQDVWAWLSQGKNQVKNNDGNIVGFKEGRLFCFISNSNCVFKFENFEYWKKHTPPRLIRVNGVEVPAPLESLDGLHAVYVAITSNTDQYLYFDILLDKNAPLDYWLRANLCYATKEDAIKRAEAMLKFEVVE